MGKMQTNGVSRRRFLKTGIGAMAAVGFPTIVPATVFGQFAPSKRINVGCIGAGRISRGHDMALLLPYDRARIMAVCDLDAHRVEDGKKLINDFYAKKKGQPYDGVTGYANYHELLANKEVDALEVSTPDHWHALIGVDAVRAGKDVYLQKPASLTIAEGRALSNAVQSTGRILQIGSQQRSTVQFRYATELVRIGDVQRVEIGLPGDHGRWQTTTMMSSIRLDGTTACMALEGTTDTESFRAYVEVVLVPTLRSGDLVVMDNLSPHKSDPTLALITHAGAHVLF